MKARLAAATAGPWSRSNYVDVDVHGTYEMAHVTAPDPKGPEDAVLGIAMGILRDDAELIAHAPSDLAKLHAALDAVEALAVQLDEAVVIASENPAAKSHVAKRIRAAIRDALGEDQ